VSPAIVNIPPRFITRFSVPAFLVVLVALLVPYEWMVRASGRKYGSTSSKTALPRSLTPKIDAFVGELQRGRHFATLVGGTSRGECGIRPDILAAAGFGPAYNLSVSGSSSLAVFRIAAAAGVRPARLVVSVSPLDLELVGAKNSDRAVERARTALAAAREPWTPAAAMRAMTWAILPGAAPDRHRNLGQWLELYRDHGDVLKFLNNDEAIRVSSNISIAGYSAPTSMASAAVFALPRGGVHAYMRDRGAILAAFRDEITRARAEGTGITLVRIPTGAPTRRFEDAQTTFDADVRAFAESLGIRYIDGRDLVGEPFTADRRNFSDPDHLNFTGSTVFSRALTEALRSGGA
jgi:hypothetical protein